jgi:hypothetical protein
MALDPRIRDSAGQFSAKGTLNARALRKAWSVMPRKPLPTSRGVTGAIPTPSLSVQSKGTLLEFDAVSSTFTADKIDTVNAVIRGVSVITSGLIARGHDLEVDGVTLDQMQKCADAKGQVPVKVDHKSGAAAVCGFLTNFRREENKLKADWFLLDSHPQKAQILEVARRMPRGVGLSASFVSPDKPEKTKGGKNAARCEDLISVDYVTLPAANPDGMFAALVDSPIPAMTPEEISALVSKAVSEAVAPLAAQIESLQSANDLAENPPSLEDVAGMSEAELATLGLTPADVQEALEAAAQGEDAGDGEGEGEGELVTAGGESAGSEGAAPAPAATGLDAITKQLVQLSAEIASLKGQKAADAEDVLLSNIEAKVELLAGENARLTRALEAGGTPATVGVDRNNVKFFSAGKDAGEFENLVQFNIEEKKLSKLQAFQAAIKENPAAYDEHLVRSGVRKAK